VPLRPWVECALIGLAAGAVVLAILFAVGAASVR
jgi:hypothetical protein